MTTRWFGVCIYTWPRAKMWVQAGKVWRQAGRQGAYSVCICISKVRKEWGGMGRNRQMEGRGKGGREGIPEKGKAPQHHCYKRQ